MILTKEMILRNACYRRQFIICTCTFTICTCIQVLWSHVYHVLAAGLAQSRSQKITVPSVGDHRSLVSVVSRSRPGVLHHVWRSVVTPRDHAGIRAKPRDRGRTRGFHANTKLFIVSKNF